MSAKKIHFYFYYKFVLIINIYKDILTIDEVFKAISCMYVLLHNAFLNKSGQNKGRNFVDPEI